MKNWMTAKVILFSSVLASQALAGQAFIVDQDFAKLFNNFRFAQPKQIPWAGSFFAYANKGTAMDVINGSGVLGDGKNSSIFQYDQLFNGGKTLAFDYEVQNHSCENVPEEEKDGCRSWWGHCNGWAAAAIKEVEPRKPVTVQGKKLEVGHVKGLLTELWLTTSSDFLGETDKSRKTDEWIYKGAKPLRDSFWDVTPRQLMLSFMNHVGASGKSLVIDRFSGNEVWNQPLVGYRILPLRSEDLGEQTIEGVRHHYAQFRMKIYWAQDNVEPGHVSRGFNIAKTSDSEYHDDINSDYDQRLLKFKLFFDAPVEIDSTGTKILKAGNLVNEGRWYHQENPSTAYTTINHTHPDFLWYPQTAYVDTSRGYGNPYINVKNIESVAKAVHSEVQPPPPPPPPPPVRPPTPEPPSPPAPAPTPGDEVVKSEYTVVVGRANIYDGTDTLIAERLIARIFRRSALSLEITKENITFEGSNIRFKVTSANGNVSRGQLRASLQDVEAQIISID